MALRPFKNSFITLSLHHSYRKYNKTSMKKVYFITILSFIAIICLQITYVQQAYFSYTTDIMSEYDKAIKAALTDELHNRKKPKVSKNLNEYVRTLDSMSAHERDSLMKACPPDNPENVIDVDSIRKMNIGITEDNLIEQVLQDKLQAEGYHFNLSLFNKVFNSDLKKQYLYRFLLLDKNKAITDSIGERRLSFAHSTILYPIGTKRLQYLQAEISIPFSNFITQQIGIMIASLLFVLIALGGLAFQLVEIKRRNENLKKRTQTVNGRIHDLKTPLNSTIMVLNRLQNMEQSEVVKKTIQINAGIVRRMLWHIEEILQTVRRNSTQLILSKSTIRIQEMVEGIQDELNILYKKKPHVITIQNDLPSDIVIKADPLLLENAICNILENSLKYSDDGVKVLVHLQSDVNYLNISIKDNGWGIPAKYKKRVFNNFFRVKRQNNKKIQGYGIGLGRVRSIIQAHNGTVNLDCPQEGGTVVAFQIPLL